MWLWLFSFMLPKMFYQCMKWYKLTELYNKLLHNAIDRGRKKNIVDSIDSIQPWTEKKYHRQHKFNSAMEGKNYCGQHAQDSIQPWREKIIVDSIPKIQFSHGGKKLSYTASPKFNSKIIQQKCISLWTYTDSC